MVRSASCFKLVVCVGDEKDEFHHKKQPAAAGDESAVLSDKRRWSFRRKSSSQRVIINTSVTNAHMPTGNGDSVDLMCSNNEENLSMNAYQNSASEDPVGVITNVEESTVTLIQTAVRKFWAQRELAKLKMLVKLQAAVRGYLVRKNAVGSLHCIRAIVKIQALFRARYGRTGADSTSTISSTAHCYGFLNNLLSNSFARQLMKSAPNRKHLNIKCNPSSPCPLWSWMECWTSLASPTTDEPVKEVQQEQKTNVNDSEDGAISSSTTAAFLSKQEKHDSRFMTLGDAMIEDKKKLKGTKSDGRVETKTPKNPKLGNSSVNNSPRNIAASPNQLVTESGNTKNRKSRKGKDCLSSVKKSSSSSTREISASDSEKLQQKVNRRRTSLGSDDTSDQFMLKRTDSSGSVSTPSYMRATLSAKARLFANTPPRSNPDVVKKDISLSKRHSLPVENVKQISPKLRNSSNINGTRSQGIAQVH